MRVSGVRDNPEVEEEMKHDWSDECPDGPCEACVQRVARRGRWMLRQLLPLTYRTTYGTMDGKTHFCVWRMWLGRVFDVDRVTVAP